MLYKWYMSVLNQTYKNFCLGRAYPSIGLDYLELVEHLQNTHDDEYKNKVLPSSELFPMMYIFASVLGYTDACLCISQIVTRFLKNCDFQVWYPEPFSDEVFYENSRNHGFQLVSQDLLDGDKFMKNVFSECSKRKLPFSCLKSVFGGLLLIGCRIYRYPLPPQIIHMIVKPGKNGEHKQRKGTNN